MNPFQKLASDLQAALVSLQSGGSASASSNATAPGDSSIGTSGTQGGAGDLMPLLQAYSSSNQSASSAGGGTNQLA